VDPQLIDFLVSLGTWIAVGAALGWAVSYFQPQRAKSWTKFCLNGQWKLFAIAAVIFGAGAITLWMDGQIYMAGLCIALCLLELLAMTFHGFKPLSPEMKRQIDEADPRKGWLRR
jgi:hypothetical protein